MAQWWAWLVVLFATVTIEWVTGFVDTGTSLRASVRPEPRVKLRHTAISESQRNRWWSCPSHPAPDSAMGVPRPREWVQAALSDLSVPRSVQQWVAAVRDAMFQQAGGSFSVFAELFDGSASSESTVRTQCNPIDHLVLLSRQFSPDSTTWVMHVDRTAPNGSFIADDAMFCGPMVWVHRPLNASVTKLLALTPYLFDFVFLPRSELERVANGCYFSVEATNRCKRLADLLSMGKQVFLLPECFSSRPSSGLWPRWASPSEAGATRRLPSQAVLNAVASFQDLRVTFHSDATRGGDKPDREVPLPGISLEKMHRFTGHHFGAPSRIRYAIEFDRSDGWVPNLHVWRLVRHIPRTGNQGQEPSSSRDASLELSPDGKTLQRGKELYKHQGRVIRLTRLSMVNLQLLLGLQPNRWTRHAIYSEVMRLESFWDCTLPNVCVHGRTVVWCDSQFEPGSHRLPVGMASWQYRQRCVRSYWRILQDSIP